MIAECWKGIYYAGEGAETMPDMRPWHVKLFYAWIATIGVIPCVFIDWMYRT